MRILNVLLVVLFFAAPVFAEWTPAEEKSLEGLVRAGIQGLDSWSSTANGFRNSGTEVTRGNWARAMEEETLALNSINSAFTLFFNAANRVNPSDARVLVVARAFAAVDSASTHFRKALEQLEAIGASDSIVNRVANARAQLDSIDRSLGYLEWKPEGWPSSIGPHGDHDRGQFSLARIGRYGLGHMNWDMSRLFNPDVTPVFPEGAKKWCAQVVSKQRDAFIPFVRAWGLDGGVILDDDEALIQADTDAGSGLRPFSFFRILVQAEYMLARTTGGNQVTDTVHSGRTILAGMPQNLDAAHSLLLGQNKCFEQIARANGPQWTMDQIIRVDKTIGDREPKGRLAEWIGDLTDFWKDMDNATESWIAFFHDIPAPPGGGGQCPEQVPSPLVTIDGVPVECKVP